MKLIRSGLRLLSLLSLSLGAVAPGALVPAAAADPPPPDQPEAPAQPALGLDVPRPTGCVGTTLNVYNYNQQYLPDLGTITSTVSVNLPAYTYIWDNKLSIQLTHTYSSDVVMDLISPAGTDIVLTYRNGDGHADIYDDTV